MASAKTRFTKRKALEDGPTFTLNLELANQTWQNVSSSLSEQIGAFREDVHGGMTSMRARHEWEKLRRSVIRSVDRENINLLQEEKLLHQLGHPPLTQRIRRARRKARAVLHSSRFP